MIFFFYFFFLFVFVGPSSEQNGSAGSVPSRRKGEVSTLHAFPISLSIICNVLRKNKPRGVIFILQEMLNYCIMCFRLHVCAITLCKTLCRWSLLSCMFSFVLAVLQVLTMCCMYITLGCVFPSESHVELIRAVDFFLFNVSYFTLFSRWSLSLKDSWLTSSVSCLTAYCRTTRKTFKMHNMWRYLSFH